MVTKRMHKAHEDRMVAKMPLAEAETNLWMRYEAARNIEALKAQMAKAHRVLNPQPKH